MAFINDPTYDLITDALAIADTMIHPSLKTRLISVNYNHIRGGFILQIELTINNNRSDDDDNWHYNYTFNGHKITKSIVTYLIEEELLNNKIDHIAINLFEYIDRRMMYRWIDNHNSLHDSNNR